MKDRQLPEENWLCVCVGGQGRRQTHEIKKDHSGKGELFRPVFHSLMHICIPMSEPSTVCVNKHKRPSEEV